eukprot:g11667.t1
MEWKKILYTKPQFRRPDSLPMDFLSGKMVKLRLHRVEKVQETKTAQEAKQSTKPFIRVHVLDLSNGGKWLQKYGSSEVFTFPCKSGLPPAGPKAPGSQTQTESGLYLPSNDENVLSAASQKQVTFVRPFDTVDCPGIQTRSKKNAFNFNNKRSWDFVFNAPAHALVNPNVLFVFEILEKPKNAKGPITKLSWGYLRLDQLYANGVDLPWELNTSSFSAAQTTSLGVFSQMTEAVNPRFSGVWLQLHEFRYTKDKAHMKRPDAHVCEDLQTPMVFHELQDLRKIKKSSLLVSAQLVSAIPGETFDKAVADSRSAGIRADGAGGFGAGDDRNRDEDSEQLSAEAEEFDLYRKSEVQKHQRAKLPLPDEFAYQLPSDGRGCHRICFSPKTSRFLACAVELPDEGFEIRVFDLAKAQVHCVCHGHRELVYDMAWVACPASGGGSTTAASGQQPPGGDAPPNAAAGQDGGAAAPAQADELPGQLVTASSDGTVMVFEIPAEREWRSAINPSQTLYHPSYCYSVRPFEGPGNAGLGVDRYFLLVGGHTFGLKAWKVTRKNMNELYGGQAAAVPQEPVAEDWRVVNSQIAAEIPMEDRSHVTCVRFGQGKKSDVLYTAHSIGYITAWKCTLAAGGPGSAAPPNGQLPNQPSDQQDSTTLTLQQVGLYKAPDLFGLFIYSLEVVSEELTAGKIFGGATLTNADEWVLVNAKDNLIRLCALQNNAIRVFTEMSGTLNSKFPIRSCIAPDGKTVVSGCMEGPGGRESGRLFFFNVASGKHVEEWSARMPIQLSSPIVDVAWSKTHHMLGFGAFGEEEPPILVYRHVNTKADRDPSGGGRAQLMAQHHVVHHDMHNQNIGDWSSSWLSHGHPTGGPLGHDKKSDLKRQIMAQVMDAKRHSQVLEGIEKKKEQG